MSSAPSTTASSDPTSSASSWAGGQPARLELKPAGLTTGHVDGGWWPRSRDLQKQLPALLAALGERLGRVEGVSYHLGDWETAPRRIDVDGVSVRVAGYHHQPAGSIDAIGRNERLTLLVVGPEQAEQVADEVLRASAQHSNTDEPATLLANRAPAATGRAHKT